MKSSPKIDIPILAFDWGIRRIGVAFSPDGKQVFTRQPLTVTSFQDALMQCEQVIREEKVAVVVLGLPIRLQGTMSETTRLVTSAGSALHERLGIPVQYQDERFSSKEAETLRRAGSRVSTDSLSASLVLKTFLHLDV